MPITLQQILTSCRLLSSSERCCSLLKSDLKRLDRINRNNNALQDRIDEIRKHGGRVDCWNIIRPTVEVVRDLGSTLSCRSHRDVMREEREFAKLLLQKKTRAGRDALAMEWLGYAQRLGPVSNYPPKWWRFFRVQVGVEFKSVTTRCDASIGVMHNA